MRLLVICEPKFDSILKRTVNLAMNEILRQYQNFFEEVHCLCPGDTRQLNIIGDSGIIFHTVDYYKGNKLNKLSAVFRGDRKFLDQVIKDFDISIIQYRIPSFFSLGFYRSFPKIDVIRTTYIAGDMYENLLNNFRRFPFIKWIAGASERLQDKLIKNSIVVSTGDILAEKYKRINPNIHPYYSTTHNDLLPNANEKLDDGLKIVFLGRIDEAKRLNDLVEATKILLDNNAKFFVNVIGDGPFLQSIKDSVNSHGLSAYFDFHGYLSDRKAIDSILCISHVIVLPSVTEGTAKVLPEAMSRGVIPIAVRNVGSNNYIIQDGFNGYLFSKYDTKELADIFIKFLESNENYLEMRKNCYSYAEDKTASKEIKKMWDFVFKNIE